MIKQFAATTSVTYSYLLWPCDKPVYIPRHFSNHFLEVGLCEKISKKIKSHLKSHIYRTD